MTYTQSLMFSLPLLTCISLLGCGGNGSSHSNNNTNPNINTNTTQHVDYSKLTASSLTPESFREASAQELELLIKNGLRLSLANKKSFYESVNDDAIAASEIPPAFSGTNVQVQGVDEADYVKYDGKHIFLAAPVYYANGQSEQNIKIFTTDPESASVTELSNIDISGDHWSNVSDLYLHQDNPLASDTTALITIRRSWDAIILDASFDTDDMLNLDDSSELVAAQESFLPSKMQDGVDITLYDVRSPSTPDKAWSLTLDGNLLTSRKIDNTLYVVTNFIPSINNLDIGTITANNSLNNESLIANTELTTLLPHYSINGGSPQPLISGDGCLVSENTTQNSAYANLVNITAINLSSREIIESVCINSQIDGIYSSQHNIYLGGSKYQDWNFWQSYTVIHQFGLTESGVDYRATGTVEGTLGWSNPAFRMDEHNGNLRLMTSSSNQQGELTHRLHILGNNNASNQLTHIAQLPNELHPEPIGKPGEDIYSVRFHGERAYVVTFKRIDPLYVLDLANPAEPKIAGELEVPGFSTYLHPINNDYLFAFGNKTDANGMPTGIKVSLFDTRNIDKPTLVNSYQFGDSNGWSNASFDYHALSFLQPTHDQLRISFPMVLYKMEKQGEYNLPREAKSGLQLFEVNGLSSDKAQLEHVGEVISENGNQTQYPFLHASERGIMHNNTIFHVKGANVKGRYWPTISTH